MNEVVSRRLIILRHAKSDWPDVPDRDRPLADRGRRDAPEAGRWLRQAGLQPDLVFCSEALRARQTWELVAAELAGEVDTRYSAAVYDGGTAAVVEELSRAPETVSTLAVVGHNPVMEQLVATLTAAKVELKTSAIAVLEVPGPWSSLGPDSAQLRTLHVPRG